MRASGYLESRVRRTAGNSCRLASWNRRSVTSPWPKPLAASLIYNRPKPAPFAAPLSHNDPWPAPLATPLSYNRRWPVPYRARIDGRALKTAAAAKRRARRALNTPKAECVHQSTWPGNARQARWKQAKRSTHAPRTLPEQFGIFRATVESLIFTYIYV